MVRMHDGLEGRTGELYMKWHFLGLKNPSSPGEAPSLVAVFVRPANPPFTDLVRIDFGYDTQKTRALMAELRVKMEEEPSTSICAACTNSYHEVPLAGGERCGCVCHNS